LITGAAAPWTAVAGPPLHGNAESLLGDPHPGEEPRRVGRLALALRGGGAAHGDLLACNALLVREGGALAARLVDLEDVRLRRRRGPAAEGLARRHHWNGCAP